MELKEHVKEILLDEISGMSIDEAKYFLNNPDEYSCINGCITSLIYYTDTDMFARTYIHEILFYMKEVDLHLTSLNEVAWFGFEYTVPLVKDEVLDTYIELLESETVK